MPEATLTTFNLEGSSPEQLEQRRREIVQSYGPNALDKVDDMSLDHLRELAALTAALRRRTTPSATGKKAKAAKKAGPKVSADDLLSSL